MHATRKRLGQFFTPSDVAETLVKWVAPQADETILDPSCGDGEFLRCHSKGVGVDLDAGACADAVKNASHAEVIHSDFFQWAARADRRFEAALLNRAATGRAQEDLSGSFGRRMAPLCRGFWGRHDNRFIGND